MKTERLHIAFAILLAAQSGSAGAQILKLEAPSGHVTLLRGGQPVRVIAGAPVIARDRIETSAGARVVLKLAGQGELILEPSSTLYVEQVPYADFAPDLKSSVALEHGSLHVSWRPSPPWALDVQVGPHRYGLDRGQFRFNSGTPLTACSMQGAVNYVVEHGIAKPSQGIPRCGAPAPVASVSPAPAYTPMPPVAPPPPPSRSYAPPPPAPPPSMPPSRTTDQVVSRSMNREVRVESPEPTGQPEPAAHDRAEAPAAPPPAMASLSTGAAPRGGWAVNLASVPQRAGAEQIARRFEAAGYTPVIVVAEVNGRNTHRVQVQGYVSKDAAEAAARSFAQEFGIRDAWIIRSR